MFITFIIFSTFSTFSTFTLGPADAAPGMSKPAQTASAAEAFRLLVPNGIQRTVPLAGAGIDEPETPPVLTEAATPRGPVILRCRISRLGRGRAIL
jgi:hypothetical protein